MKFLLTVLFVLSLMVAPVANAETVLPEPIVDCSTGNVVVKWGDIERGNGVTIGVTYHNAHEGKTVSDSWTLPAYDVTFNTESARVEKGEKITWTISALRVISGEWTFKASVNCGPATPDPVTPEPTATPAATVTPEPPVVIEPTATPTPMPTNAPICRYYLRAANPDLTPVSVPVHFNGLYVGNTMIEEGRHLLLDVPCGSWNYLTVGTVNLSGMKLVGHSWMAPVQPIPFVCAFRQVDR